MRTTQQMSITLPKAMARQIRAKVTRGEYATESEVIREGLRALMAQEEAVEEWLRTRVAQAYDAHKADPARALPIETVRASLAATHRRANTGR